MIAVAMSTSELFTSENLELLKTLTDKIDAYDQVERVLSLSNAMDIQHKMIGVRVTPVLKKFYEEKEPAEEARVRVLSNELYVNNLVSPDGTVATILIYLKQSGREKEAKGKFIQSLYELLKENESQEGGRRFYIAGSPIEQYEFVRAIRKDQFIFVPMITILLIITTWAIYRNFACMFVSMCIVFMTLIWSMGTITVLKDEINLVTSLLAPVIMIVAVVNSIHLINLFFEIRTHHTSFRKSVILTMDQLGVPCFLSHFTTVLGFVSLMMNPVPAIQSFGLYAALGTVYSYLVEIFLTPILMPILPYKSKDKVVREQHHINRAIVGFLERIEFKGKWWIIGFNAVLFIFSLIGITHIEVDTSLIKQMKPDSNLAIATKFIDDHLTGVYALGFMFEKKDGTPLNDQASLEAIDRFKTYLESKEEIVKVNVITTLVKKINFAREGDEAAYSIPDDERIRDYFDRMAKSKDPELWKLITPDFKQIRLEARMKAVGTREGSMVEDEIRAHLKEQMEDAFNYHLTGNVVLLGKMAKGLVYHQLKGFGFAFVSIMLLIALIFRSLKMGLLAAIPNLFPIFIVYGLMGYLGIELSTPTAMISSIVLGMVVDASIHFLHRFRHEFERRGHYLQALHHTFRNVGMSLVVSTVILTVGFASSVFASFKPTIYLGVFTSLTIFFALICTLVILPVCLIILKPFGPQKSFA